MGKPVRSDKISVFGKRIFIAAFASVLISSCAGVAPVLKNVAVTFAQNLLASATQNISPQYSQDIERLLVAFLREKTGLPTSQDQYGYGGGAQDQYGYGVNTQQDPYGTGGNAQDQYGYGGAPQDQYGYGGAPQAQDQYGYGANTQPNQYGYGSAPQAQNQYGYGGAPQDQYGYGGNRQDQYQPRYRGIHPPISMDVGLLAQKSLPDGSVTLEAIQDGAVLHDGRGNPEAGDKLKISFKTNCNCYAYVIGIDATGYVVQIFPDPDSTIGNPVSADRQYMFPEGNTWWGLDDYRGVETVYFVASHTRRADIEDIVAKLAGTERRVQSNYKPVEAAAVIPQTRGLVKVQSAQTAIVTAESGSTYEIRPTEFTSAVSGVDLVITRWFTHQ